MSREKCNFLIGNDYGGLWDGGLVVVWVGGLMDGWMDRSIITMGVCVKVKVS